MDTNGTTDSSTPRNPSNMALREMRSNALIPSTEVIVAVALISVIPCKACATHSHPARVDSAYWKGAVTTWTVLTTAVRNVRATYRLQFPQCCEAPPTYLLP